ncbi:MAG: hypothetical protein QM704_03225 [Anaeromyxobacteraceae bacterium]
MSLPPREEREALLSALAGLVEARGHLPLVSSHLLEPTPRYFPDAWRPDADGVANVCRRLLGYAGLGEYDVAVEVGEGTHVVESSVGSTVGGTSESSRHAGAAGWFLGFDGRACHFGVDVRGLGDPEGLVATLCHEVAHAYRRAHGLEVEDRATEELLTDVTTVYLGFGILTTNGSYRYRKSGELQGVMTVTRWSHSQAGYLSPDAMSFLLAAAVTARRLDGRAARRVEGLLESNQAGAFHAALKALRRPEAGLLHALGLPDQGAWPAPPPLPAGGALALPDAPPEPAPPPAEDAPSNAGRPVFRVRHTRTVTWALLGLCAGLAATAALVGVEAAGGLALSIAAVGGAVAGAFAGARAVSFTCSDPGCRAPLTTSSQTCPRCGGEVGGDIVHEDHRLVAEEAYRRRRGEPNPDAGA